MWDKILLRRSEKSSVLKNPRGESSGTSPTTHLPVRHLWPVVVGLLHMQTLREKGTSAGEMNNSERKEEAIERFLNKGSLGKKEEKELGKEAKGKVGTKVKKRASHFPYH